MAKTIKFNIMCDGYPCRNIEDVQEHFCIEDMLEYYESGLLKRWLEVRGFKDELAEVEAIKATEALQITEELIRIFEILTDEDEVKEAVSLINYQKKRQAANQANEERGYQSATVITNYVSGYESIVKKMLNKSTPSKVVQQHINTLATDYQPLFEKNIYTLFSTSLQARPLVSLNLIYNEHSRNFLMPDDRDYGWVEGYYEHTNRTILENLRISEINTLSELLQPAAVTPLILSLIFARQYGYCDDDVNKFFENQIILVSLDKERETTFEEPGVRCLLLGTDDIDYARVVISGERCSFSYLRPYPITDGLKLYSSYRNRVAYFKVDD